MAAWLKWIFWLGGSATLWAATGSIQTKTGETFSGSVRLLPRRLIVADVSRLQLVSVRETELKRAIFEQGPAAGGTAEGEVPNPGAADGVSEEGVEAWKTAGGGEARREGGIWRLRGSGENRPFVYRLVQGRSELVGRVVKVRSSAGTAQAGLMMCETLEPGSKQVFLGVQNGREGSLEVRREGGGPVERRPVTRLYSPHWLKLRREGKAIACYRSRTGQRWRLVDRVELSLAEQIHVGVVLAGLEDGAAQGGFGLLHGAVIDQVQEAPCLPRSSFVPRVQLRSGSEVVGPIACDGGKIVYPGPSLRPSLSLSDVAAVQFQWLSFSQRSRLVSGLPGALLENGQFLEGELKRIERGGVTISSVLFGLKVLEANSEVLAVVVQAPGPGRAVWEVETGDGSVWLATAFSVGENELRIEEPLLGEVRIPAYQLREIRAR